MSDCTKTVAFLREWGRMCDTFDGCEKCPIRTKEIGNGLSCVETIRRHQTDVIAVVQKWSDEHPVMTWAGKLKELLPNADIDAIMIGGCLFDYFGGFAPGEEENMCKEYDECKCCWNGEYREAKE